MNAKNRTLQDSVAGQSKVFTKQVLVFRLLNWIGIRTLTAGLIIILSFSTWAQDQTNPAAASRFFFQTEKGLPLVYLKILFRGGSAYDPVAKQGLALLTSELLLRGTKSLSQNRLARNLDRLGVNIHFETQDEYLTMNVSMLKKYAETTLSLLEDILMRPSLNSNELEIIRKEALGELKSKLSHDAVYAAIEFKKHLYGSHPLANSPFGTLSGLKNITQDDIRWNYLSLLKFGRPILIAGGSINSDILKDWWVSLQDQMARVTASSPKKLNQFNPLPEPSFEPGRRIFFINKPGSTQSHIYFGHKTIPLMSQDYSTLLIANEAYGGSSFSSRLMAEIRAQRGWTYGINNRIRPRNHYSTYSTYFYPKTQDTIPALNRVLEMFSELTTKGITEKEFNFFKRAMILADPFDRATLEQILKNRLEEFSLDLPLGYFDQTQERLESTSWETTSSILEKSFSTENLTIVILGSGKTLIKQLQGIPHVKSLEIQKYSHESSEL